MQPVTAEQAALLTCDAPAVDFGCDLLTLNLEYLEDLSPDVTGGQVSRSMNRAPHGELRLQLSRELAWGTVLVRPWQSITDTVTGDSATWYTGAYLLTTPEQPEDEDVPLLDATGGDRSQLLDRPVAEDYTAAAGTTYRQALLDVFTAAGLSGVLVEGSAADDVLPVDRDWPLVGRSSDPDQTDSPVTWRRIVNTLLEAINFRAVWVDESGLFRCQAYRDPAARPPEFTFDAEDAHTTIVGTERRLLRDVWKTPNRWVFRQSNRPDGAPAPTEGDGIYTYDLPDEHALSAVSRGMVWPTVFDYEAATHNKLVELGDRRVAYDLRITSTLKVRTGPFPCAGHADVFTFLAGSSRKVQAASWSFDLAGSDVTWDWEVVS